MPHRIVGHYAYTLVAYGSLLMSFLVSVGQTATDTVRPMLAYGEPAVTATGMPDAAVISWLGFFSTATLVLGKTYTDWRNRKRDADIADANEWGAALADARADLKSAQRDLTEKSATIDQLRSQNTAQAAEITSLKTKIGQLVGSQNSVITAVNKQQKRAKEVVKRVEAVEQVVGSSSSLEIPPPPAEDSTAVDLPNIR